VVFLLFVGGVVGGGVLCWVGFVAGPSTLIFMKLIGMASLLIVPLVK